MTVSQIPDTNDSFSEFHICSIDHLYRKFSSGVSGLTHDVALQRLQQEGSNSLPRSQQTGLFLVFLRQFRSPLIYILLVAALLSVALQEWSDAVFIAAVLLINAIIGTVQEFSAERSAASLNRLVLTKARVLRNGESYVMNSEDLVRGDIVLLESGDRIPADLRISSALDFEVDESLLTGESKPVLKNSSAILAKDTILAERCNMAFAGSLVSRGRARGVVVATATFTELGKIAKDVIRGVSAKAPLLIRMEAFTQRVAILVGIAAVCIAAVALYRGLPLTEVIFLAIALSVSAIPEGLPVALTVALAIGMRKMSKRNVIVRRLVAVEALGSCTYIATDKTGTLTVNRLTVKKIVLPDSHSWDVEGEGLQVDGAITSHTDISPDVEQKIIKRICLTAIFPNDGYIGRRNGGWTQQGDPVDVALLVLGHKANLIQTELLEQFPQVATIPFESEHMFSASVNIVDGETFAFVKGAVERLIPMCSHMAGVAGDQAINPDYIIELAHTLAASGYRVLALASSRINWNKSEILSDVHLQGMTLLGLLCMIDPLRPEALDAIQKSRQAGINVAMLTGDHPATALAIAKQLNLAENLSQIVTGKQIKAATTDAELDKLTRDVNVFARMEPRQKLDIVKSLQRNGHFVAVSGDGANDAPALKAAEVGVAMGENGTDVARETADIIITDDNFSSIVSGIEEGRVAYANVRKVIFLLISTGAAEIVLFLLALITEQPIPLVAVQLLWLNLVTNGIQDVALAFEAAEGNELNRKPRPPGEPIFNRLMIERVVISAIVIGVSAFALMQYCLRVGMTIEDARNVTLFLMVLFENIHVFNSRSETRSVFKQSLLTNPLLIIGTLAAQGIHIGAMYVPGLSDVLGIKPISLEQWSECLLIASSVLVVMELHKWIRNRK